MTYHLLPVFDVSEACFLLLADRAHVRAVRRLPAYARRTVCRGKAVWIEIDAVDDLRPLLRGVACSVCATGTPCPAWCGCYAPDYRPRAPHDTTLPEDAEPDDTSPDATPCMARHEAAAILGVPEGADAVAVRRAFARAMLVAHPDRGGTVEAVTRLVAARAALA